MCFLPDKQPSIQPKAAFRRSSWFSSSIRFRILSSRFFKFSYSSSFFSSSKCRSSTTPCSSCVTHIVHNMTCPKCCEEPSSCEIEYQNMYLSKALRAVGLHNIEYSVVFELLNCIEQLPSLWGFRTKYSFTNKFMSISNLDIIL